MDEVGKVGGKREPVFIAYADVEAITVFDFRGCNTDTLEELEKVIRQEVREILSDVYPRDIRIYYRDIRKGIHDAFGNERIQCDAQVVLFFGYG